MPVTIKKRRPKKKQHKRTPHRSMSFWLQRISEVSVVEAPTAERAKDSWKVRKCITLITSHCSLHPLTQTQNIIGKFPLKTERLTGCSAFWVWEHLFRQRWQQQLSNFSWPLTTLTTSIQNLPTTPTTPDDPWRPRRPLTTPTTPDDPWRPWRPRQPLTNPDDPLTTLYDCHRRSLSVLTPLSLTFVRVLNVLVCRVDGREISTIYPTYSVERIALWGRRG